MFAIEVWSYDGAGLAQPCPAEHLLGLRPGGHALDAVGTPPVEADLERPAEQDQQEQLADADRRPQGALSGASVEGAGQAGGAVTAEDGGQAAEQLIPLRPAPARTGEQVFFFNDTVTTE